MIDTFKKSADVLAHHYEGLEEIKGDFRNKNLNSLVSSFVKGDSVLDVGAGAGFLLELLSKKGKRVVGIEPNQELLQLTKARIPSLDIRRGDITHIHDVVKDQFLAVVFVDVLEHLENDHDALERIKPLLSPGGRVIIVVPAYPSLYGKRDEKYGHYRRYSKEKLTSLISQSGYTLTHIQYWNMLGVFPYWFYEKIFQRALETNLRKKSKNPIKRGINVILDWWFRVFENQLNLGFGLSIIAVAEK